MYRKRSHHLFVFCLAFSTLASWIANTAEAQSFGRAINQLATQLSKSSDESVRAFAGAADHFSRRGDEVVEKIGESLGRGGPGLSSPQALQELRRLGVSDPLGELGGVLDNLTPASRQGLVDFLEQSKRAIDVGVTKGMDASSVLKSLDNGGADALSSVRSMKSDEAVAGCLRGLDEYGEAFNTFVRKGDEAAVRALDDHWELVIRLPKAKRDDFLTNPAKYIEPNGRLTRSGDELLRTTVRLAGMAAIVYALMPDSLIGFLAPFLPPWALQILRNIKWFLWWSVVLGLSWFLSPIILPVARWMLIHLLRVLGRLPGSVGKWLSKKMERAEAFADGEFIKPRTAWTPPLRIGLLGVQRVGKSTFIVMLQKHLAQLVRGASLKPVGGEDQEILDEISEMVSQCKPTLREHTVNLNLTWPFDRDGNPRLEDGDSSEESRGVLKERLVLTDFPGEWAATKPDKENRKKLIGFLKDVDGLFVVIDPTELEDPEGGNRASRQIEAIQAILREDGLGLGKRFHRAMAVLLTKRDALDSLAIDRLNLLANGSPKIKDQSALDGILAIAEKESLDSDESQKLGDALFDLLFPEERMALKMQLAPEIPIDRASSFWERLTGIFRRSNCPQFAVFAISQLGRNLGQQVVEYRRRVDDWEKGGRRGEKPSVALDLANADPSQLDLRHPFQWMFDRIPKACLYQADHLRGPSGFWYRLSVHRRFRGASVVRHDRRISWARRAALMACIAIVGIVTQPIADWRQRQDERQQVNMLFEDAAGQNLTIGNLEERLARVRALPTNPMPAEMTLFESLLMGKKRLDSLMESSRAANRSLDDRLEDQRDWLRTVADLAPSSSLPSKSLRAFRDRIVSSTPEVSSEALRSSRTRVDELVSVGAFEDARAVAENLSRVLGRIPDLESIRTEALQISADLDRQHFQHDLDRLRGQVNKLLAETPPEYLKAVEAVDGIWAGRQKTAEMALTLETTRSELTSQFRDYVESRLDNLIRLHDADGVTRLLEQLERCLKTGDPAHIWIRTQRVELPDRRVRIAVADGRLDFQQGEADSAWEKLSAVRVFLIDSRPENRKEWYEVSAKVRLKQQEWEHAISLFCEKDIGELPWAREGRNKAWHDWTESLEKTIPLLLTQGKTEEVLNLITKYQYGQFAETCPPEDRDRVGILAAAVPQRELGLMLEEVEEQKDLAKALQTLMEARTPASRVRDEDTELLIRWRKTMVDVFQELGRHPEAVSFLRGLSTDPAFSTRIPSGTKPVESDVWEKYLQYLQETYESLKVAGKSPKGWSLLAKARADVLAPETFCKDIEEFASTRVNLRLADLRREVEQRTLNSDFIGARAAVQMVTEEFGDWAGENSNATMGLKILVSDIRSREIDYQLKAFEEAMDDKDRRGDKLHQSIALLATEIDLNDDQRNRLSRLREVNLLQWEKDQFDRVKSAYDGREFVKLEEELKKYLAESPFHAKRTKARLDSLNELQAWLDQFERENNYTISAIRVKGMPGTYIYSLYDPAVKVTIKSANPYSITAKEDNKQGSFELKDFKETTTFRWKRGVSIEICIWNDYVDHGGHCFGKIELNDPYSLLNIGLPNTWEKVSYKDFDYGNDSSFNLLQLGLTIGNLELPPLAR